MNGPEHYLVAERLLQVAEDPSTDDQRSMLIAAHAQVHAMLAKVAVLAESSQSAVWTASPRWREIIGQVDP